MLQDEPAFTAAWAKQMAMMQWMQRGGMLGLAGTPPGSCGTGQCAACKWV